MIQIKYGKGYSDDTFDYIITFSKPMTVGEFIEEWIADGREWGYFGIYDRTPGYGNPKCEYRYGKIITDPLPQNYLNAEIEKVYGNGGWSRSNFRFVVKEEGRSDA